ncbi:hypothetical protein QAD02_001984 [Eretmocerus hayati]|uniref:Uncharacterized protein n=1 Tax=Eretmocerus hayati TaxID=131215 RepID=A0ACC2NME5_9HYME|nr:hypothetical protein QAD02_001984 [Eretmocerus hayati]
MPTQKNKSFDSPPRRALYGPQPSGTPHSSPSPPAPPPKQTTSKHCPKRPVAPGQPAQQHTEQHTAASSPTNAFAHVHANKVVVNGDGTRETVIIGNGEIILDRIGTTMNKGHERGNPRSKAKSRKCDGDPDEVSRENSVDGNRRKSKDTVDQISKRRSNTETNHDQNEVLCEKSTNVI